MSSSSAGVPWPEAQVQPTGAARRRRGAQKQTVLEFFLISPRVGPVQKRSSTVTAMKKPKKGRSELRRRKAERTPATPADTLEAAPRKRRCSRRRTEPLGAAAGISVPAAPPRRPLAGWGLLTMPKGLLSLTALATLGPTHTAARSFALRRRPVSHNHFLTLRCTVPLIAHPQSSGGDDLLRPRVGLPQERPPEQGCLPVLRQKVRGFFPAPSPTSSSLLALVPCAGRHCRELLAPPVLLRSISAPLRFHVFRA